MKFDLTPKEAIAELQQRIDEADTREVAHFIVWYVEDLVGLGRISTLEKFIALVQPGPIPLAPITYILRSSYTIGHQSKEWVALLKQTREVFKDEPRLDRILIGLDQPFKSSW